MKNMQIVAIFDFKKTDKFFAIFNEKSESFGYF